MSKQELLAKLAELGVNEKGRKIRSDKGKTRAPYKLTDIPRADKGQPRSSYNKSAAYHRKIFNTFLRAHTTDDGTGDNLNRDYNGLFPPNLTNFYKTTSSRGKLYKISVKRNNHPELLRWQWWMAEHKANPIVWGPRIAKWYFIQESEITSWTYSEWAWAYVKEIGGIENRQAHPQIILSYDDFMNGHYGYPNYTEEGEIKWYYSN